MASSQDLSSVARARRANQKRRAGNSDRRNIWLLVAMTFIAVVSVILFMPPSKTINQGLDLQGGLSVVLTAKSTDGSAVTAEDMEASRSIIESRVNALGATEATVQVQGTDQILVQLPGMTDTEAALATIGKTGKLVFARLDSFTDEAVKQAIEDGSYMGSKVIYDEYGNMLVIPADPVVVTDGTYTPLITGANITRVTVSQASEASVYYSVNLDLDAAGTAAFAQATKELAPTHGQIVIILDDVVQSAPSVQSEIPTGDVSITGNYSLDEAKALKTVLESGSLPVTFEYAQSQIVGPTLGQDTLRVAILVALAGLALVMLYLLFFYKGLGIITAAAMAVFAVMYLGLLALLSRLGQFSLTLAGLAGIVLTIGMAADSSILTLERFREEIRMGRSVRAASITGVHHAIMTSIDADLVTLVSALSLFFLASASVKGFGLTLALGIMCDILMMVIFKAPLIRLMAPRTIEKHPEFWGIKDCQDARAYELDLKAGLKPDMSRLHGFFIKHDINFLGYRRYFLGAAAIAMALCIILVPIKGISFGIEFVGGSSASFYGTGDVTTEQVRAVYAELGEPDAVIQTTQSNGENGFLVRTTTTDAELANAHAQAAAEKLGVSADDVEVSTIGPDWGASVIRSSVIAFLVSLILIIIYIAIRFEYKMGIVAIVALLHDLILVVGVYALVGREITPNTIAALLTILGYSLYDTVVVFHRINENMKDDNIKCTFMTMANHSINQVLLRSINTTLTSLIPVLAMLIFGSATLKDFAFAMVIGLLAGTYSSVAVATPLFALWKTREPKNAKLVAKYGDEVTRFWFGEELNMQTAGTMVALPDGAGQAAEAPIDVVPEPVAEVAEKPAKTEKPAKAEQPAEAPKPKQASKQGGTRNKYSKK